MIAAAFLAGCAQGHATQVDASRVASSDLLFFNDPITQGPMIDQVVALTQSADDLVRASRVNGALMGAALGCGVTMMTGSDARTCIARAALTGAGGAVIGNIAGQRDVARRVELVEPNEIARTLNTANSQFESIKGALPQLLAQQEAELNSLTMELLNREITLRQHNEAVRMIEQDRADLAEALTLSARDARQAARNLQEAERRGQNGLEWHIDAAGRLADDVESTRSSFDMTSL